MKIVVLMKVVPDTYGDRVLDLETGLALRDASDYVLDEIGERALEVAVRHAEAAPGTGVVALCMGPSEATTSLRRALALGADSVLHVIDDALAGADLGTTADVLAAAVRHIGFDLLLAGNQSTDGAGGVVPSMLAELLDVPNVTSLKELTIADSEIAGDRVTDHGTARVRASLPAVASLTEAAPDPRIPNFKGIMAAKKKPLDTLSLDDLKVAVDAATTPRSIILSATERPTRTTGTKILDDGSAGTKVADFLLAGRLV